MKKAKFVHLHLHTQYSLLDGAVKIKNLIEKAKKYNIPAVTITDHGNLFGVIEFYKSALAMNIKPIIGMEAYLAPESRFKKDSKKNYHLILLVKDYEGYKNLIKLSSISYAEGFYYKPRIDKEILQEYSNGLIGSSACIKGEIPTYLSEGKYELAKKVLLEYKDIFNNDFYIEIMRIGVKNETKINENLIKLSRETDTPLIATNDVHYLNKDDAEAHDILLAIQTKKDIDDKDRMKFPSGEFWFKTPSEMEMLFSDIPEAIENTVKVAEKCNLHLELDPTKVALPKFDVPEQFKEKGHFEYLKYLAENGLNQRTKVTPGIKEKLEYELSVIKKMGLSGYFLIIKDIIDFARSNAIYIGPGRGSAVGSLTLYGLGITDVDPTKYGLIFERFLNPERVSMPDVDIDFEDERRDEILKYIKQKYHKTNVAQIITFDVMKPRSVIKKVGKVLKLPFTEMNELTKLIGDDQKRIDDIMKNNDRFKNFVNTQKDYQKLISIARKLEGLVSNTSTHAAGVVITPEELTNYVPLYRPGGNDDLYTQYPMKSLEDVGVLKIDILGLKTLSVIKHSINLLRKKGIDLQLEELPKDDKKTFDLIKAGDTNTVFQLGSRGMKETLKLMQPSTFEDLIAVTSFFRPGPLQTIDPKEFAARMQGKIKEDYIHPKLEPILKETYGIMLYQEQVMKIAHEIAGFSLGQADILRKAMGKKKPEIMENLREEFIKGAEKNGLTHSQAGQIFDIMERFSGYGFNKSHSTGYAYIAYYTAYLKAHYPLEFFSSNLTNEKDNAEKIKIMIEEAFSKNIIIYPPDVNESYYEFVPKDEKGIRFGFCAIKNIGKSAVSDILKERGKGKFKSFQDFLERVQLRTVNKKVIESLIKVGAFDTLNRNRASLMVSYPKIVEILSRKEKMKSQKGLFAKKEQEDLQITKIEDWDFPTKLNYERESLGFYFSGHPLSGEIPVVKAVSEPISAIYNKGVGSDIIISGIITSIKKHKTKKLGKQMAYITVEDMENSIELTVFSDIYNSIVDKVVNETKVVIEGSINEDRFNNGDENGKVKLIARRIIPFEEINNYVQKVYVAIYLDDLEKSDIDKIYQLCTKFKGITPIHFVLKKSDKKIVAMPEKVTVNCKTDFIKKLSQVVGDNNIKCII